MHLNFFSGMLADAAAAASTQAGPQGPEITPMQKFISSPMFFILPMFLMLYFITIRPQQQRAKQQQKMLGLLKAGDRVVTASGIIGTVTSVKDKSVALRSAEAKFEVTKASVTEILEVGTATETKIQ